MKQLTIDTSANLCAAAIFDLESNSILSEITLDIGRGHAEVLMGLINDCLNASGTSYGDLGRLAVTIGPGSFTGVRVGMAVAKGLKLGLSAPLVGVSTLDASVFLAREQGHAGAIAALMDAKRDQAYCRIEEEKPFVASYDDLSKMLAAFEGSICGSGATALLEKTSSDFPVVHSESAVPISAIARLAASQTASGFPLEPLYLRSADAKVQTPPLAKSAGG